MAASTSDSATNSPPDHSNRLLAEINLLKDQFCDFVLMVENERFPVHKIIMASASYFIRGLLSSDMKEQREGEVKLETLDRVGVRAAIDFVYSGQLDMNSDKMDSIVKAASYLQIPVLIDSIIAVFRDTLSVDNCVEQLNMVDMYNLDQMYLEYVADFVCDNFVSLPTSQICAFSDRSLISCLSSNKLKIQTELKLIDVVQIWMLFHKNVDIFEPQKVLDVNDEPWVTFTALMTCIRWSLIPPTDLCDKLNPAVKHIMSQILECTTWLVKANEYHHLVSSQPVLQDNHSEFRGKPGLCASITSMGDAYFVMHDIQDFSELYTLTSLPNREMLENSLQCHRNSVVSVGDFLYVISECKETVITSDVCYRYDPRFDKWWQLPPMNISHSKSSAYKLFAHTNKLYIINSLTANIDTPSEYYNINTNEWTLIEDNIPDVCDLCYFAGCVAEHNIYISGGHVSDKALLNSWNSMNRLDTDTNTWQKCSSMMIARAGHVMENIGEFLYVIAGLRDTTPLACASRIERYSICSDQWTICSKILAIPVLMASSFTKDNGIYIVGGSHKKEPTDDKFSHINIIQFFSETCLPVETTQTFPQKITDDNEFDYSTNIAVLTASATR